MQTELNVRQQGRLFISLLMLTVFLILTELSVLVQCSGIYLGDFKMIANHLSIPSGIIPGVLYFASMQLLIHFLFTVLVWLFAIFIGMAFDFSEAKIWRTGIILWILTLAVILFANRVYLPNSKFANALLAGMNLTAAKIIFVILLCGFLPAMLCALFGFGGYCFYHLRNRLPTLPVMIALMFVLLIGYTLFSRFNTGGSDAATAEKPDIIIIGIDSVRPDFLGFFGPVKETPHIDGFLNHATVFSDALTPLARTYPAWVSILTGLYPKLNSIRTDLADQSHLDVSETLPRLLQNEGYQTVFATDETRFSNIDERYGFDKVITPPTGFNDFLIGTINDFPISNLLINTALGQILFPHSYGNRAVIATYDPNSFLKMLEPTLKTQRKKPMLFIVHFCLPHFPYAWESLPAKTVTRQHYLLSLRRADQQFHDFMKMLEVNHFLNHSVVVILSDHGEAVEIPGDRITDPDLFISSDKNKTGAIPHFYPPSSQIEKVDMSGGHGTDVLGLPQYHTVLAFRTFGLKPNQIRVVPGLVSLMDIKPTILTMLDLPVGRSSGDTLNDSIFGNKKMVDPRQDFFTESDFSPESVRTVHPEERKVLFEGIDYFRIDPKTTHMVVRDSMMQMILSSKQFADYYGDWVLALYPQNKKNMMPVLVNLKTGYWTVDLNTPFAEESPAHHMLVAMKIFFGKDITSVQSYPSGA